MPCTGLGWGIIYPLIVHDKHPDIEAYDKLVGIDDIVMGDEHAPVEPGAEARKKRQLAHVKQEEKEADEARRRMYNREPNRDDDDDDERVGPEPNPGINQLSAHLKKKKQRRG
jgi:hypothetical protein